MPRRSCPILEARHGTPFAGRNPNRKAPVAGLVSTRFEEVVLAVQPILPRMDRDGEGQVASLLPQPGAIPFRDGEGVTSHLVIDWTWNDRAPARSGGDELKPDLEVR